MQVWIGEHENEVLNLKMLTEIKPRLIKWVCLVEKKRLREGEWCVVKFWMKGEEG